MRRLLALTVMICAAGSAVGADSTPASLRVGVEVTRTCSVASSPSSGILDVRCTRATAPAVQTSIDGRASSPTPLVRLGPGVVGASVPVSAPGTPARIVTVLF